jgi:hypothetical protein
MSPETELYLRVSLVVPFLLVGLLAYAMVRRYRGLPIPGWVLGSGSFVLGFSLSSALVLFVTEPIWVAALSAPALWIAWQGARRGRLRLAGLVVLGLALPGAVWWGRFVIEDVLDPASLYEPVLLLWWLPGLLGVLAAVALLIVGDGPDTVPPVMRRPPNVARDPMALGNALQRAIQFGPYPFPTVVAESIAFVVIAVAVPVGTAVGIPWPLVVPVAALGYMFIGTEAWYLAYPPHARPAWEAFAFLGNADMQRFRDETGTDVPNTERRIHAWLRDNPERPETRWARAELLAVVGRVEEARTTAARIEARTEDEIRRRDETVDYIDWISGKDLDFHAIRKRAEAAGEPGSLERRLARGSAAIALARDLAAKDGDWQTPLADLRSEIGAAGWAAFRRDTYRRRLTMTFVVGLVMAALMTIPGQVLAQLI